MTVRPEDVDRILSIAARELRQTASARRREITENPRGRTSEEILDTLTLANAMDTVSDILQQQRHEPHGWFHEYYESAAGWASPTNSTAKSGDRACASNEQKTT